MVAEISSFHLKGIKRMAFNGKTNRLGKSLANAKVSEIFLTGKQNKVLWREKLIELS